MWHQDRLGIRDVAEAGDNFGAAVTVGDFNGDTYDDLAVGVPNESVGAVVSAGAVNVFYGSATGIKGAGNQRWHQNMTVDVAEAADFFGSTLMSADFNNDGNADLVAGAPGDSSLGGIAGAGSLIVLNGDAAGLTAVGNQYREQDALGDGLPAANDGYGAGIYGP